MAITTIRPSQIANVPLGTNLVDLFKSDPTEIAVTNTVTETTLWSATITGGVLGINDALRIMFYVSVLQNSGATQTYTFRLKFGGTTVISTTGQTFATPSATAYAWQMSAFFKNVGATNSQKWLTWFGSGAFSALLGTSAIDTTANQTLSLTVQASSATATQTVTQLQTFVEYMKNT